MITVSLGYFDKVIIFETEGHSKKRDVCIAMSTLSSAFHQTVINLVERKKAILKSRVYERGKTKIEFEVFEDYKRELNGIILGIRMLEANFSDEIKFLNA
jgi:uncharacterized protein YsxB (DUF464 family)